MKLKRPGAPRLLPIVIFAAVALLAFKGIGLLTNGGYVLTGTTIAHAAEGEVDAGTPSAENAAPGTEPTMSDAGPTIVDPSPTLAVSPESPPEGAAAPMADPAAGGADAPATAAPAPPANSIAAANQLASPAAPGGPAVPAGTAAAAMANDAAAAPVGAAIPSPAAGTTTASSATPAAGATAAMPAGPAATACPPGGVMPAGAGTTGSSDGAAAPMDPAANCDVAATKIGPDGRAIPFAAAGGGSATEQTLLQRLGERRAELDKREADLNLRAAIVAAAEKQMQQHADALKALEAQVSQNDSQQKAADDTQVASVVKMYETMKPQEAAAIFDGLDINVLLRIAKAMDPRKMSPILAKMTSGRAQEVTTRLAAADPPPAAAVAAADPSALPQIVGH